MPNLDVVSIILSLNFKKIYKLVKDIYFCPENCFYHFFFSK